MMSRKNKFACKAKRSDIRVGEGDCTLMVSLWKMVAGKRTWGSQHRLILHYGFTCYVKLELWHLNQCIVKDKLPSFSGLNDIVSLSFSCTFSVLPSY